MWWQWCLGFVGLCVVVFGHLAAFWLGGKVAKGEEIKIRKKPLPVPTYLSPNQANALRKRMREEQEQPLPTENIEEY